MPIKKNRTIRKMPRKAATAPSAATAETLPHTTFASKAVEAVKHHQSHLCLGIDAHFRHLPAWFEAEMKKLGPDQFHARWVDTCLEAAGKHVAAVKFQSAFFESFGPEGYRLLQDACLKTHRRHIMTILDAKRCDISSTMAAYGQAAFVNMKADVLTIMPSVGTDAFTALSPWLSADRGVYVVLMSSNPSAREIQDLTVSQEQGESTVAEAIADLFQVCAARHGLTHSLGFVIGATKLGALSDQLVKRLRGVPLLMPGVGVQGGAISSTLKALLASSPGTLVPMSRSLTLLGDPGADDVLKKVRSWADYGRAVESRTRHYADQLRPHTYKAK